MAKQFVVGESARIEATCVVGEVETNPTTITLTITEPNGDIDTYTLASGTIEQDETGVFHIDRLLDSAGQWLVRCETTGDVAGAADAELLVRSLS